MSSWSTMHPVLDLWPRSRLQQVPLRVRHKCSTTESQCTVCLGTFSSLSGVLSRSNIGPCRRPSCKYFEGVFDSDNRLYNHIRDGCSAIEVCRVGLPQLIDDESIAPVVTAASTMIETSASENTIKTNASANKSHIAYKSIANPLVRHFYLYL